ncbi:hypothetical protein ERO13_A13G211300v2 [Gossypium hirsutum]|uniref:Glucosidase 2 subunit beta n=2 Tax=Gossypium TaxID=3633 RepID=A0A1U8N2J6_GOSHI|nr:glucosidase 2 subunit beta [Gossypium hirsutum]KAG4167681.1 hypothetical protein ERO13_A13G211300v2 [Gossypium hirsutum]TYH93421.1 hypothetical protein ES332_A13G252800v1 [Gossypium tomentosum]
MRVYSIFILFFIGSFLPSSSSSKHHFLGISPQDENYYKSSSDTISCKDGSKKFSKSQFNDDFCDCLDGTDEPGTSACPTAKFYCKNAGHIPQFLFSSRVNDGICDCCDGSDEYDGQVKCPNMCWEAGKVARDRLIKKIATYKEGAALRKLEVEKAKVAIAKKEAELTLLKNEEKVLKVRVRELKEHKELIEKEEEKVRLQKEMEEKGKREAEEDLKEKGKADKEGEVEHEKVEEEASTENQPTESTHDDIIGNVEDSSSKEHASENTHESASPTTDDVSSVATEIADDAGSKISPDVDKKENEVSSDISEGMSREELGRIVASRWTGESTKNQGGNKDHADDSHEETPKNTHDEQYDHHATDTVVDTGKDDNEKYDYEIDDEQDESYEEESHDDMSSYNYDDEPDLSDTTSSYNSSWLEKIQQKARNILKAFNLFQTPVNLTEAATVRKKYVDSGTKLSKIQSRISKLKEKLKHDFGPEKEFYAFYGHCFETNQNKYVYKVCPYKQASQEEGYTSTSLGNWDQFEESYRMMVFSNGENCWNGPDRSMKVKLRCGLKNEITDVDEPSRCEYVAILSTPAVCLEDKLKELQHKLDLMNKEQPREHDEL